MTTPASAVVCRFYEAIVRRDYTTARECLAPDMVYHGVFKVFSGRDAYLETFQAFMEFTTRLDVQWIAGEGADVAIFYEMETTRPQLAVTFVGEWHQVRDGLIVHARAACDGRPFISLFSPSNPISQP